LSSVSVIFIPVCPVAPMTVIIFGLRFLVQ
jgi:hypothetical protein